MNLSRASFALKPFCSETTAFVAQPGAQWDSQRSLLAKQAVENTQEPRRWAAAAQYEIDCYHFKIRARVWFLLLAVSLLSLHISQPRVPEAYCIITLNNTCCVLTCVLYCYGIYYNKNTNNSAAVGCQIWKKTSAQIQKILKYLQVSHYLMQLDRY